jgi:cysteine desulfurase/selenocysteine lyase
MVGVLGQSDTSNCIMKSVQEQPSSSVRRAQMTVCSSTPGRRVLSWCLLCSALGRQDVSAFQTVSGGGVGVVTTATTARNVRAASFGLSRQPSSCPSASVKGPLHVMKEQETPATTEATSETAKEEGVGDDAGTGAWWKSFELKDEALAHEVRDQFPILASVSDDGKPLVYLDSAATSQKPLFVTDALTNYYHTMNSNVHRGAHRLSREATNRYEAARDEIAKLVNAPSRNEIVYTSGATEAINLVAYSWARVNLKPGDEIVTTVAEHHSNIVPWQMIAQETGAVIRYVPIKTTKEHGDFIDWDLYKSELFNKEKTKLVAFQHASNVLGMSNPVEDIVQWTKEQNPDCLVLLDACQSVPHQPVDVQALGVDFMAVSGHKMCGPTGIGFLWGREELLNNMGPFMGGGEMIQDVTLEGSTYAPAPGRFEAGTPQIAQAIGLGAAVQYLQKTGMERINKYEHELGYYLQRRLEEVEGVRVLGPKAGPTRTAICTFVVEDVHPSDLSTFLDMEGVAIRAGHHCCQPLHTVFDIPHSARASCYFYNTKQ